MSTDYHHTSENVVLRLASGDDALELRRLAELDSSSVSGGVWLLAEVDGRIRAAVSGRDRQVIADPFHPTAHLVEMLTLHLDERAARNGRPRRERLSGLLSGRRAPWPA